MVGSRFVCAKLAIWLRFANATALTPGTINACARSFITAEKARSRSSARTTSRIERANRANWLHPPFLCIQARRPGHRDSRERHVGELGNHLPQQLEPLSFQVRCN